MVWSELSAEGAGRATTAVTTLTETVTAFSVGVSSSIGVMGLTRVSVRFTTCSMVEETLTSIFSAVVGSDNDLDGLNVAVPSHDAAGSDGVREETLRVTLGVKDSISSEFVLESLKVSVFVRGLEKACDKRVPVMPRLGVTNSSMETTLEERRIVGLSSMEPT